MRLQDFTVYFLVQLWITICIIYSCKQLDIIEKNTNYFKRLRAQHNKCISVIAAYGIYILFSVFRKIDAGYGGADANSYRIIFERSASMSLRQFISSQREEMGFSIVVWLLRRCTNDYRFPLFIFHTFIFACFVFFIQHMHLNWQAPISKLAIFVMIAPLFTSMCILRTDVATAFSLIYFYECENRKYFKALIIAIMACLFHVSAIVLFFSYIYLHVFKVIRNKSGRLQLLIIFLSTGVLFWIMKIISPFISASDKYKYYADTAWNLAWGTYTVTTVVVVFMIWNKRKAKRNIEFDTDHIILMSLLLCFPIQSYYAVAYRMLLLFMPMLFKCIASSCDLVHFSWNRTTLQSLYIHGFSALYLFYRAYNLFFLDYKGCGLYPYVFGK